MELAVAGGHGYAVHRHVGGRGPLQLALPNLRLRQLRRYHHSLSPFLENVDALLGQQRGLPWSNTAREGDCSVLWTGGGRIGREGLLSWRCLRPRRPASPVSPTCETCFSELSSPPGAQIFETLNRFDRYRRWIEGYGCGATQRTHLVPYREMVASVYQVRPLCTDSDLLDARHATATGRQGRRFHLRTHGPAISVPLYCSRRKLGRESATGCLVPLGRASAWKEMEHPWHRRSRCRGSQSRTWPPSVA